MSGLSVLEHAEMPDDRLPHGDFYGRLSAWAAVAAAAIALWVGYETVQLARETIKQTREIEDARREREVAPLLSFSLIAQEVPIEKEHGQFVVPTERNGSTGFRLINLGEGPALSCRATWDVFEIMRTDGTTERGTKGPERPTCPVAIPPRQAAELRALPDVVQHDADKIKWIKGELEVRCEDSAGVDRSWRQFFQMFVNEPGDPDSVTILFERPLDLRIARKSSDAAEIGIAMIGPTNARSFAGENVCFARRDRP